MAEKGNILPRSLPPRGLSRVFSAAYIGVSPTKFDELVADGRMPKPKQVDGRNVFDRLELDIAFDALPMKEQLNPWDEVLDT